MDKDTSEPGWYSKEKSFLRQYARAVTSDQVLGDEIVAAALADFEPSGFDHLGDRQRRISLFRTFYDVWRDAQDNSDKAAPFSAASLLAASPHVASRARQLVLLVDVVGIAVDMAAELLELEMTEARELLTDERAVLNNMEVNGTSIVIEDEPLIAMDVGNLLEVIGLKVVGSARSAEAAISLAKKHEPDIVLADFDLGGGPTGLDAIKSIAADLPVIAVFLTAYPDEVLSGGEYEPTFVLTKPFNERALRTAVMHGMSIPRAEIIS
ncbi:response regulator [Hyphococcus sp.]|uniref:response regulator n=1 Tax=Hyphococcus sp. TaxID=2038636 RepID=UPI003CCB8733